MTDLGTEFGVEVDKQGATTSHVFRGLVKLQLVDGDKDTTIAPRILHENETARVEKSPTDCSGPARVTIIVAAAPVGFVREIPKQTVKILDLVDVVAGGDGFSGRRSAGIDPTTGRLSHARPNEQLLFGDHQYHRVNGIPAVDGVFIPDGSAGPVRIDSAGHTFADCPETDNRAWSHIWAGGEIPTAEESRTKLGEVDYASPGHGMLDMHANKGITFDLEAIRRANPGTKLLRFRTVVGNTKFENPLGGSASARFWVLVDGQVRFRRREVSGYMGAMPINMALGDHDRFLTLLVTDGGQATFWSSLIIFGDPRLELLVKAGSAQDAGGH